MAFDPFGDFETKGYLRNHAGLKNTQDVKRFEHSSFARNVPDALAKLDRLKTISTQDVQETHKTLFQDAYPWAGETRTLNIHKGEVSFQPVSFAARGLETALQSGNNAEQFRQDPGKFIGEIAYAHPFLDGNGRTITTVTDALARKADFHIRWEDTNKSEYLTALTKEINEPYKGHLTEYLKPHIRDGARSLEDIAKTLTNLRGLSRPDEQTRQNANPTLVLVEGSDPASKAAVISVANIPADAKNISPRTVQEERQFTGPNASKNAVTEAVQRHHDAIQNRQSFIVESTLASGHGKELINQAREAGFKIELHAAAKQDLSISNSKLDKRLPEAISAVDKTVLYDQPNNDQTRQVATLTKASFEFDKNPPKWAVNAAIRATSIDHDKAINPEEAKAALQNRSVAAQAGGLNKEQVDAIQRSSNANAQQLQRQAQQRDNGPSR